MKKIPTIFKRNPENMAEITEEVNPICDWVFLGEGVPTYKYNGTCCMVNAGKYYKRREIKPGKAAPENFVLADYDPITKKTVGWMPVDNNDKWHTEAIDNAGGFNIDGTYELIGPKIQGNPEGIDKHVFVSHVGAPRLHGVPRSYDGLKAYLNDFAGEGIVFHHEDGRMAKIKKRDFK